VVVRGDQACAGGLVGDGLQDGVVAEERVAGEVHLGDQALGEGRAEEREVDVRGPPGVGVVAPGVGARLDGGERVPALIIRQASAHAREVRVQRGRVLVALVRVPARGVGLPDLHQLPGDRAALPVQDAAGDGDALAERFAGVLAGQVGVQFGDVGDAEDRAGQLDRVRVPYRDQRLAGVAQRAAAVGRVAAGGMVPDRPGPGVGLALGGDLAADVRLGECHGGCPASSLAGARSHRTGARAHGVRAYTGSDAQYAQLLSALKALRRRRASRVRRFRRRPLPR
jgi:hypothetical protein